MKRRRCGWQSGPLRGLPTLRARLEANRTTCGLFDGGRFARNLEQAYGTMWEILCAGREAARFCGEVNLTNAMAKISEKLAVAVKHHQAGRLEAAEQIYRQVLRAGRIKPMRGIFWA